MDRRNRVEWIVLVVSVIAIATVVGVLVIDGVSGTSKPPSPVVNPHFDEAYVTAIGWVLPATVSNEGERSAQKLTLVATATVRGEEEESEITIDYLPAGTDVEIALGFSGKPDGDVTVRVVSFAQ
ncbi:MAG: hypothetical protein GEU79_06145 [Acidimicrobiia bacterium]|nr:hypothetical protein [Acidimicrobiia bacterium]